MIILCRYHRYVYDDCLIYCLYHQIDVITGNLPNFSIFDKFRLHRGINESILKCSKM